ncbi:MAG: HYR domain-containing protein [Flavobacteriaceae bacterium]|nr:HYR domain-containing protein [Flavobacteriaceae bacterium]
MKKVTLLMFLALFTCVSFTGISQNIQQAIDQQINQMLENNELTAQDVNWAITNQHISRTSNVHHVYYRQLLNGIEIYGTESSVHLMPNGTVLKSNNRFVDNVNGRATSGASPTFTAIQAVQAAANHFNYNITGDISVISSRNNATEITLTRGGISLSDIPAQLVYQETANGEIALAWDISIEAISQEEWWSVRVNATNGAIIDQVSWMSTCNFEHDHNDHNVLNFHENLFDIPNYDELVEEANKIKNSIANYNSSAANTYEVFPIPVESPYYTVPQGTRTTVTNPANLIASPFGWHDTDGVPGADSDLTTGNNADAYDDGDNPGYRANGGPTQDFVGFPFSMTYSAGTPYEDAAITNLFYWTNIIHDVLYLYGFDEVAGNFQSNNYGNGGLGGDWVRSEAQDGSGTCNANFFTPPDGSLPRMQMYTCGDKDGDFDNLVIIHEYAHGISNRLTGGPSNTGCLGNQEQMGEGWSDFYGVIMTIEPGDLGTDPRGVGTYLFGQGAGGPGIRPFPYSTDFAVNPQTYDDIKTAAVPHGVGSVWSSILWEVTWELIGDHGFDPDIYNFTGNVNLDAGNVQAFALVTEAMKLQPCSPGFVDGRDAIFAADVALYGGANECALWDAFARRGLGISADQGSSGSRSDGTEAFDTPSGVAMFTAPDDVCANTAVITGLGGGTPSGGVYSGPGVTDDGNGSTYSFDPVAAGVGVHTITYDVPSGPCSTASSASDDIEVLSIPAAPATTGVSDFCVGDPVTVSATPSDPLNTIGWYDAPTGGTFLHQGTSYTFTPTGSTSVWAQEQPPGPLSQLKISEITLQTPDRLEIQNVGLAEDYTGYAVAVSETPYSDINTVNPDVQILGAMGADSVLFWDDSSGSAQYWGSNIFWNDNSSGWIVIIDDVGNVVDSVFWNVSAGDIAGFNVTINGFNITAADLDWSGVGAAFTQGCADSYRRNDDTDDASNWADVCLASDYGVANADINLGFSGCLGDRGEAVVTADASAPTITCPADVTVGTDSGACEASGVSLGTPTVTDNCPGETFSSDAPATFPLGDTTVTWTATDAAGNTATCTQIVTVVDDVDPTIACPADETVTVNQGEMYTLPDYTALATVADNCTASPAVTQSPTAGTDVGAGDTVITLTVTDDAGNSVDCTFTVTVDELLGINDAILSNQLVLYPNPTRGAMTLVNNSSETLTQLTITDVNGRTIQTINLENANTNINFSIEQLATGMYFVRINSETSTAIKQIVKQ